MVSETAERPIAVTVATAAKLLGVSKASIRAYAKCGRLPVARLGRRVVVPLVSLERLIEEATQRP